MKNIDKKTKFIYGAMSVMFFIYALTLLYPFVYAFLSSVRDPWDFLNDRVAFPETFNLSNYIKAFTEFNVYGVNFIQMFVNSVLYTLFGTLMALTSSTLTAYVIAKYKFRIRGFLYGLAIFTMIVPIVGSMPSMYKLVSDLGLKDNVIFISLLHGGGFGMNFFILHGFFSGISWSYAEAGLMDGASNWEIFTSIMLPQAKPALVAVGVTTAISTWNDYLTPFLYLENQPTLAYGIYYFEKDIQFTYNYPVLFAGILLSALPVLIIFMCFQKSIMENTVAGGLKG